MEKETPKPTLPPEGCHNCRFARWTDVNQQLKRDMLCARFPPSGQVLPTPQGPAVTTIWPIVHPTNWCGEFHEKTPELARAN